MLQELRHKFGFEVLPLAQGMQKDAATWQTLLDLSGGKLAVAKCLYYLGHWRWTEDGVPELTPSAEMGNLITLNDDNGPIEIPHFDTKEAHLTLGVWKSLSGNLQKQYEHLQKKSTTWTSSMIAAPLTKDEAFLSFTRIYIPSLCYGLGTCFFSPADLRRIQRPAVNAILPKMGYNRHTPRDVVFGPRSLGALGLPDLVFEQGVQQLQFLGRHLRSPTSPLRSLFQIAVEWFRMLSGYTTCPLATPQLSTIHVELAPWFTSLQNFLKTINHSVEIPNLYCPRRLRENDQAIMSISQAHFSNQDLLRINRCRLYLQVHMVSEISTTDGRQLLSPIWRGQQPTCSVSKLFWPRQQRPSSSSWRVWRQFLSQLLRPGSYNYYSTHLPLRQTLGAWHRHFTDDRQWLWFYSRNDNNLLQFDLLAKSYQVHPVAPYRTRLQSDVDPEDCCYTLPNDAIPCEAKVTAELVSIPSRFPYELPISTIHARNYCPYTDPILPSPNTPDRSFRRLPTWSEVIQRCASWEVDLLPTHVDPTITAFLRQAHLHQSTIYHCSDGSAIQDRGTFGWAFGPTTTIMLRHSGPAFGSPMDSYLAESYGLLASSCFWYRITQLVLHRRRPNFKVNLYCDNKSLIRRVNAFLQQFDGSFRRGLAPNYDVIFLIACVL